MNANKDHIEQITDEILTLLAELATSSPKWDGKYTVLVDDNYHYMNEEYRYTLGVFDTKEEALQAAKSIVDSFLLEYYKPGTTAESLYNGYVGFGEDPWGSGLGFSAWTYAKQRCAEICGSGE